MQGALGLEALRISRFGQEFFGLFRMVFEKLPGGLGKLLQGRVTLDVPPLAGPGYHEGIAPEISLGDGDLVNRQGQGLPHPDVIEGRQIRPHEHDIGTAGRIFPVEQFGETTVGHRILNRDLCIVE